MSIFMNVFASTEELAPLVLPVLAFPLIAAVLLTTLGFVTWSFRDVANRQGVKPSKAGSSAHDAGN
jgi:nitrate reductase NapE component